jgi:hypothetical protein
MDGLGKIEGAAAWQKINGRILRVTWCYFWASILIAAP